MRNWTELNHQVSSLEKEGGGVSSQNSHMIESDTARISGQSWRWLVPENEESVMIDIVERSQCYSENFLWWWNCPYFCATHRWAINTWLLTWKCGWCDYWIVYVSSLWVVSEFFLWHQRIAACLSLCPRISQQEWWGLPAWPEGNLPNPGDQTHISCIGIGFITDLHF